MSYPRKSDPTKCPEIVPTTGLRMNYHQCRGKVVKDGYCRVHHPDAVKERRAEAQRKYDEKWAKSPSMLLKGEQERSADLERKLTITRDTLVKARGFVEAVCNRTMGEDYRSGTLEDIDKALAATTQKP